MKLTTTEAKDYIKEHYTESYLQQKGIPTNRNIKCLAGKHEDKNPSMGYDARAKQLHCFTCDARLDIFDLIGMDYGEPDFNGQLKKACELYGIELVKESTGEYKPAPKPAVIEEPEEVTTDKYTEYFKVCNQRLPQKFPKGWRGVSLETLNHFNIGYDAGYQRYDGAKPVEIIVMPVSNGFFTPRAINPAPDELKNPYRKGDKRGLFNADALEDPKRPCIVCEGELDCMSVYEVGGNAVGLGGTSGSGLLLRALEKRTSTTPLVLSLDNDSAGERCRDKIISEIESGIKSGRYKNPDCVRYIVCDFCGDVKDANDKLQQNRYYFQRDIEGIMKSPRGWNYTKSCCSASFIGEFSRGVHEKITTPPISTGFKNLDSALDGGLYPGLIALGAVSSLGKTTLCQQIGDNICASGHDVIYVSLEMSRFELMAKTISRFTYMNVLDGACGGDERNAKTTRGILDGSRYHNYSPQEKDLIALSVDDYKDFMERNYILEGMGNIGTKEIREFVKQHIEATEGRKPVVIVDYLQILAPADARGTDKQNVDKNILELKRLSRDYNIPVIVISSFNRSSYASETGVTELAFKESGAIEYGTDILIGLQFSGEIKNMKDVREAKARNPREIEAVIIKNRNAKIPETPIQFYFNPLFNYFEEVEV